MPLDGIPFEKWSFERKTKFVIAFATAYNEINGNKGKDSYGLTEASLKATQDYDFALFHSKGSILKVQHTLAGADVEREYVRPNNLWEIIEGLKPRIEDLKGLFVSLNMYEPTKSEEEKERLIYWLNYIIRIKSKESRHPFLFSYDKRDEEYIEKIKKWIDRLEIIVMPDLTKIVFGLSTWRLGDGAVLSNDIRVDMAVGNKEEKYTNPEDLILLVHFETMPTMDFFLPKIKGDQSNTRFYGVWLYDAWQDKFIQIK